MGPVAEDNPAPGAEQPSPTGGVAGLVRPELGQGRHGLGRRDLSGHTALVHGEKIDREAHLSERLYFVLDIGRDGLGGAWH
jgi:hypothetical protein